MRYRKEFPGVTVVKDRHGKLRYRLRRTIKGRTVDCYLPGVIGSTEFRAAYHEATEGVRVAGRRAQPGTIGYLVGQYLASAAYRGLADSTRRDMRGRLDWIRDAIGGAKYAKIEPRHVAALMEKKGGPAAANRLRKDLGQLYRFAGKRLGYGGRTRLRSPMRTRRRRAAIAPGRTRRSRSTGPRMRAAPRRGWQSKSFSAPARPAWTRSTSHVRTSPAPGSATAAPRLSSKSTCRSCRSSAASCPTSRRRRWCCCPARMGRRATPTSRSATSSGAGAPKPGCRAFRCTGSERRARGAWQRPVRPNLRSCLFSDTAPRERLPAMSRPRIGQLSPTPAWRSWGAETRTKLSNLSERLDK